VTTDIETERLRDAVVEAALNWCGGPQGLDDSADLLEHAAESLRAHLAKAAPAPEFMPCPFCGGEPTYSWDVTCEDWDVLCTSCRATVTADTEPAVLEKWNTRHSPCVPDTSPLPNQGRDP
jgi:hypothetical protein